MAQPRKRVTVHHFDANGKRCRASKAVASKRILTTKYYGWIRGKWIPLSASYDAAKKILARKLADQDLLDAGIPLPLSREEKKASEPTIGSALDDYAGHLRVKGDTPEHIAATTSRITALFSRDSPLAGLTATVAVTALDRMRAASQSIIIPAKKDFLIVEVCELLGVSRSAIAKQVVRLGLTIDGWGKTRRYSREAVEALVYARGKGASPETINHYIRAVRAFARWLARTNRLPGNPLESLSLAGTTTDRRHDRRELSPEEVSRLLQAAGSSRKRRGRLRGPDRKAVYLLAYSTGWRAAAIAAVTPSDFRLDDDPPIIVMPARVNKSRKVKKQPLSAEAVAFFREYLQGKRLNEPLWPGEWRRKAAQMMRGDLKAAGIPYRVEGPDGPLYADFHSLRHAYITALGRAGVDLRTVQELAGHSTPVLTARYMHRSLSDQAAGAARLPEVTGKAREKK